MCREVGPRQILISMLAQASWEQMSVHDLLARMQEISKQLEAKGATVAFVACSRGETGYWSDDFTYELGLLTSAGFVTVDGEMLARTGADYDSAVRSLCADLDPEIKDALSRVA